MADDIGISRSTPKDWQDGKATPRFDTIKKLSDYFGVPVTYFTESSTDIENQIINDNHGIIGHAHAPVTISENQGLSMQELELIEIYRSFPLEKQLKLLSFAFELKKEQ